MVQIKAVASLLIAAAAVAPALAQGYYYEDSSLVTREDVEDLADLLAREYGYDMDIEARDFDDMEDLDLRDLDEIFERSPFLGYHHVKNFLSKHFGSGRHAHGGMGHEHHHGFEHHGEFAHQHHHHQEGFGGPSDAAAAQPPADAPLSPRDYEDFDELVERDPFLGYHHVKKFLSNHFGSGRHSHHEHHGEFAHHHHHQEGFGGPSDASAAQPPADAPLQPRELEADYDELLARYFDDLYERELSAEDEYTELAARAPEGDEFEMELVQRSPEPGFIEWIKHLFHPGHKKDDKKHKKDDKKDKKDDKKDEKKDDKKDDTKDKTKSDDKKDDKDDSSLESREFDDFWYDLD